MGTPEGGKGAPGFSPDDPGRVCHLRGRDRLRRTDPHPWKSPSVTFFFHSPQSSKSQQACAAAKTSVDQDY